MEPRRSVVLVALPAALLSACPRPAGSPPSPPPVAEARVVRVVDGDTIRVLSRGADERVRLIGIDAPEVASFGGEGECFGPEAAAHAERRLGGRTVGLELDRDPRDRFGRLLAYVHLGEEVFNLTLVRKGYAVAMPVPPNVARREALARAERRAREEGRGLWSRCRPQATAPG